MMAVVEPFIDHGRKELISALIDEQKRECDQKRSTMKPENQGYRRGEHESAVSYPSQCRRRT